MDEGVPKSELGDFFQAQVWCATWLVSLSVGDRARMWAGEGCSGPAPWAGGWRPQPYMEWWEAARGGGRAFPWGSYEGLCQGRAVPTCFEIMAFQVLEDQLGMPGRQVRRKTGEETSRGHPQSVNRPPDRKLPANRPKPENRTPVPAQRKGGGGSLWRMDHFKR